MSYNLYYLIRGIFTPFFKPTIMKTFTIDEIRNYILSKDSLGDVVYFLSEKEIEKANKTIRFTLQEIMDGGR